MTRDRARRLGLAALAGILYFVGFVGFGQSYLTWLCFVPVLVATRDLTPRTTLAVGAFFGLITHMGGYYWVIHLLKQFANLPTPLAFLGYVLLCGYQGASLAVVLWCVRKCRDAGLTPVTSLPVVLAAVEWFYPFLFPSYIGNSLYELSAITQIVELFGLPALSVLVGLVNGGVYEVVESRIERRKPVLRRVVIPTLAFAASLTFGILRLHAIDERIAQAEKLEVAIVQTNLGAKDKHELRDEFIRRHVEMSVTAQKEHPEIQLFVWPESAYNSSIPKHVKNVSRAIPGLERPVIFGAIGTDVKDGRRRAFNTAIATSSTGDVRGAYDKIELLAFGETIPLVDSFPALQKLFPYTGVFTRGTAYDHLPIDRARTSSTASPGAAIELLPMICYEDIIPELVRMLWSRSGPPHALVNITNDSWYGDTHEPLIHLALASFRSIETRRALIRSTNTGISAFVDPAGRIVKRTGQWTRETMIDRVALIDDGSTTLWLKVGPVVPYGALAMLLALMIRARRRRLGTS
ncbi:MAG: apolipoprotein N-acyltransferase [Deltaproteobacteria bacterium]|nr:apolipoprotein N-acyltransferase [Deltaproteobacteria bacterium]